MMKCNAILHLATHLSAASTAGTTRVPGGPVYHYCHLHFACELSKQKGVQKTSGSLKTSTLKPVPWAGCTSEMAPYGRINTGRQWRARGKAPNGMFANALEIVLQMAAPGSPAIVHIGIHHYPWVMPDRHSSYIQIRAARLWVGCLKHSRGLAGYFQRHPHCGPIGLACVPVHWGCAWAA